MTKAVVIIGGGIAGMQAALDLADQGFMVYVVEKNPSIGGRVAQLDKTFPTLDCAACILTPKMFDVGKHPNIKLLTYSEVKEVRREGRNFKVKILKKPRYVDEKKCIGCGACAQLCPVEVPNDFDERLGFRSAIYIQFSHAVPLIYTIDKEHCLECDLCKNLCKVGAINKQQKPEDVEIEVGVIIVATGFDLFDARRREECGFGLYDNVITGLSLERLLNISGPTGGRVVRPSDGKIPKKVAFIQCVGPRDEKSGNLYCSKVCCMYATKEAELLKKQIWGVDVTIYHMDFRAFIKGFEEFYHRAKSEFGIKYVKGKVSQVRENPANNNLLIQAVNIDSGEPLEDEFDMVVVSTGIVPAASYEFEKILPLKKGEGGFFVASDPKIDTVTTDIDGVFLAGVAEGPKDILESISQAKAAAMKASIFLKE